MGTRGWWGFVWRGWIYYIYNQYDCYWTHLGTRLLKELFEALQKDSSLQLWKDQLDANTGYPWSKGPSLPDSEPFAKNYRFGSEPIVASFFQSDVVLKPSCRRAHLGGEDWIEFIYTINLDKEIFEVVGSFADVSEEWVHVDDKFFRFHTILEKNEAIAEDPLAFMTSVKQSAIKPAGNPKP